MNALRIASLLGLTAAVCVTSQAAPFLAISENAEVFLKAGVGVKSDSNIFLTPKATSDTIFNFDVGAELKFGQLSTANGLISISESFVNYSSHSNLNANLGRASIVTHYDDGKLVLGFKGSYVETNENQADTINVSGLLSRRDLANVGVTAEMALTEKTGVGVGVDFSNTNYRLPGFSNTDIVELPINCYFQISPKVDLSIGYRYRDTRLSIGQDSTDSFYNIGARGEFTPKLNGQFSVGYNERKLAGGGTDSMLGISSGFTYAYSTKTTMRFGVTNDFGSTAQGQQQKNLSFDFSAVTTLSAEWSVSIGASHRSIDYAARTDRYFSGQADVTYSVNANVRLTAAYGHRNNASPFTGAEFTGDVFALEANLRY
jgi:hypothetical protein